MPKSILEMAGFDPKSPEAVAAATDAAEYTALIAALVRLRKNAAISQEEAARRMATKQSAISDIERSGANPRIRTLFRYARAVGSELRFRKPIKLAGQFHLVTETAATEDVPRGASVSASVVGKLAS